MQGNWVAECTLCKWTERHLEQDDALKAATRHSVKEHPEEHATLSSGKWITHVQNRAADAIGYEIPKPPEVLQPSLELPAVPTQDDAEKVENGTSQGA